MKTWSKPTTETTSTPSGANNLNDLSDVAIANPQPNQILKYDGTTFINSEVPGLADIQANFNNLNADNLTAGTINYSRLPNLAGVVLSGDAVPPYISSITPITPSGTQTIEILGEYFSPITQLSIPGAIVDNLEVRSPKKIIASISKSGLSGNKIITLANGANTNQIWAEGIKSIDIFTDPFFQSVSLFIKGDGINNSIDIFDESPSPKTVTRFGDTKISTSQSKYGGSSIYCDGAGDYISIPNSSDFNWFDTDFTLELWYNPQTNNIGSLPNVIGMMDPTGATNYWSFGINNTSKLAFYYWSGGANNFSHPTSITLNTWNHIAFIHKKGIGGYLALNGIVSSFAISGTPQFATIPIVIGGYYNSFISGFIDALRITKGVARYTANFNPESDTYLS